MTSSITSLPEIAGDAALLIDPYDIDAMAAAIRRLDNDADLRADLAHRARRRAQDFDAASYAERIDALYQKLV